MSRTSFRPQLEALESRLALSTSPAPPHPSFADITYAYQYQPSSHAPPGALPGTQPQQSVAAPSPGATPPTHPASYADWYFAYTYSGISTSPYANGTSPTTA